MSKSIQIGNVKIGGGNPIAIQSMCNTPTSDVAKTVFQIQALERRGCEIIRVAVPDMESAKAISSIKSQINIPLVADIHFDYKLAIASIEAGADKIRINPGNIGSKDKVKAVVDAAKEKNIPIRVGVNSGSLKKEILDKYGKVTAEGLVESAIEQIGIIENMGYDNLVISIKSSDTLMCVDACRKLSKVCDYPLHLGVTEAGSMLSGSVKSAIGLGLMLNEGIGDTIRVSLTAEPVWEVDVAKMILSELGLRKQGVKIVSCPTCGRTKINLFELTDKVEKLTEDLDKDIKIAVMGCAVNGPGEAKEADIGIAGGDGEGLIFSKGEIIKKVPYDSLIDAFKEELDKL